MDVFDGMDHEMRHHHEPFESTSGVRDVMMFFLFLNQITQYDTLLEFHTTHLKLEAKILSAVD